MLRPRIHGLYRRAQRGIDLLGVSERGLVAMVSVGDEERALGDVVGDGPHRLWARYLGEPVLHVVGGRKASDELARFERTVEQAVRIPIEHETRRQVGPSGAEQLEPIF